jgi:hydroxymethylpyrimidine kinase/phosphomethylpyrimidine kinase
MKVCLTIAGVDPSGGAGVYADIKTFTAFGCYGAAAITSITFQNTQGVFGAENQTAESVRKQILPILGDFEVSALKTGMLPTREIIEEVGRIVAENNLSNLVVDPVVRSTSGFDLIDDIALESLIRILFPISDVITPNIPEAERITKMKIKNLADIRKAARLIQSLGAKNVLIKGGHLKNSKSKKQKAKDFLFTGKDLRVFEAEFIKTTATHGTGCTLAAAIAANLAIGKDLPDAVDSAKKFVTRAIYTAPHLGKGHSPINHLANG